MLVTRKGEPVEFIIEPGSLSDIKVPFLLYLIFPWAIIHADRAYTDYKFEDYLEMQRQINFKSRRRKNTK